MSFAADNPPLIYRTAKFQGTEWYRFVVNNRRDNIDDIKTWCRTNVHGLWSIHLMRRRPLCCILVFGKEMDAVMFKLRWKCHRGRQPRNPS